MVSPTCGYEGSLQTELFYYVTEIQLVCWI